MAEFHEGKPEAGKMTEVEPQAEGEGREDDRGRAAAEGENEADEAAEFHLSGGRDGDGKMTRTQW